MGLKKVHGPTSQRDPFAYPRSSYLLGEGGEMVNPAKSEAQRKLFGAALSMKRGKAKATGQAGRLAKTLGETTLREFAKRPKGGYR